MKPWKKNKKFIFVFIILLCFEFSKCLDCTSNCEYQSGTSCSDTNSNTCPSTSCRPKFIMNSGGSNTFTCHDCTGISGYYTIDSNGNCIDDCLGDKIISETKECTSKDLSSFYQLGNFYYSATPTDANCDTNNKCTCLKYYYIETIYGKKKYTCFSTVDDTLLSKYKYYYPNTGEFFPNQCPDNHHVEKIKGLQSTTASSTNYAIRCSDSCVFPEFLIEEKDANNNIINEYCVDSCNDSPVTNYKYEYTENNVKKCVDSCPTGTYKKEDNANQKYECLTLDQCNFYQGDKCYDSCSGVTGFEHYKYGDKACISACPAGYTYRTSSSTDIACYRKEDCNFVDNSNGCLSSCSGKYDYNSNLCATECGVNGSVKKFRANDKNICYDSCSEIPGGEYIYEEVDNNNAHTLCYKQASDTTCEAFYKKINGIRKCTTKAVCINTLHYKYFIGDECKESCDGYYQIEMETNDPSPLPYVECINSLSDALGKSYVNFCDTNLKKCWEKFPDKNTYYINSEFDSTGQYEVIRECPNYYYEITDPSDNAKTCFKCVDDCSTTVHPYFLSGHKKCEDDCSKYHKYYYDDSNKECLDSCELRPTKPFSNALTAAGEGTLPTPVKCINSCSDTGATGPFYDYNSHTCISQCGDDNSNNLYFLASTITSDYSNICYPSCLDIPEGIYKYELSDKSCTNVEISLPHDNDGTRIYDYYYEKSNGVIKYVKASDCENINYKYIVGNECKRNCEDNYYKIDFTISISGTDKTFTKCFSQPSQCIGAVTGSVVYYNQNLKKCWNEISKIPTNFFIKTIATDSFELVDECENYYYEKARDNGDILKYCISKCDSTDNPIISTHKYFISGNKKCLSLNECFNLHKYYYDPSNNECVETCKGRSTNKFQNELPTSFPSTAATDLKCLNTCPEYYNYDSNICLNHCGADGSNKKYHANGNKVCYPSCLDIPRGTNGFYIYEVADSGTDGTFTCYDSYTSSVCTYYYLKSDGTIRCDTTTDSCKDIDYFYLVEHSTNKLNAKKIVKIRINTKLPIISLNAMMHQVTVQRIV